MANVCSVMRLWTHWLSTSLSLWVLLLLQCLKVYLWQWQFHWPIQWARWKRRTILLDSWLLVRQWEEPTTSALIRQELWLKTKWLWQSYGLRESYYKHSLPSKGAYHKTHFTTLPKVWLWTQTLTPRFEGSRSSSNWVTRHNVHCCRWYTDGVSTSETSERN